MRHLNYNHLLYFWTVAREGSITKASELLHITPQTISGQIKLLEETIGEPLFKRQGRGLLLTETGQVVHIYADEIFSIGSELTQRLRSKEPGKPLELNIGIVNSIAKLIAYRIIEPVLNLDDPVRIICLEGDLEKLLSDLAIHKLDLILSDRLMPTGLSVKAYNHILGESTVSFFAQKRMAVSYRKKFPESLNEAPMLMPVSTHTLRRSLDDWFEKIGVTPKIVAEFDDSALLKAFGEAAVGIFPAPTAIKNEVEHMYHSSVIGEVKELKETYYAISPERKIKHPGVMSITENARTEFFK
ncbi:MAG: transcriptional activator NhaR [Gammaproteobacteria bacterium]|nr:transcriptional activator NhaR [Gammaproteobacteria bacterium]